MTDTLTLITTEVIAKELPAIVPDVNEGKQPLPWPGLKSALEALGLARLAGAAIGEPESISRKDNVYTATGKCEANKTLQTGMGRVTVFTQPVITWTLVSRGRELLLTGMRGISVQHTNFLLSLAGRQSITQMRVRMSGTNFKIDAVAGGITVSMTVDQRGNIY
jgi:hypothetical protein